MKKFYFSILTLMFILVFQSNFLLAQQGSIPEYAMGARAYAMGQIALLSFSDAVHVSMNPSSICDAQKISASIFYSKYNSNTSNSSYGIVYPTRHYGFFGISYFHYSIKGIEQRDEHNDLAGKFSFNQNHFLLMYGQNMTSKLAVGVNAKFVTQRMAEYKSPIKNIGLDFGIKYTPQFSSFIGKNLALGITMDNLIEPAIKLDQKREYLPFEMRFIFEDTFIFTNNSVKLVSNIVYFERSLENKNYTLHFGVEYSYKNIFLRMGYRDNFYSFGFGLKVYWLVLNYFYGENNYSKEYATSNNGISINIEL